MSKTGTVGVSIGILGDGVNIGWPSPANSITYQNLASPGVVEPIVLTTGFNSVAVPAGAKFLWFVPPTSSTIAKTLKGITGDTGYVLDPASPMLLPIAVGTTAIGITASAGETCFGIFV